MSQTNKLSIKGLLLKSLIKESKEPFFYLAPDVVGSINNAYPDKRKKFFVVDFQTVDDRNTKLIVPYQTFSNFSKQQKSREGIIPLFLSAFLNGVKPCDDADDEMLGEIVDEYGELFDDNDDLPADIQGNPGHQNRKSTASAIPQYNAQSTKIYGPLGYGGVVY